MDTKHENSVTQSRLAGRVEPVRRGRFKVSLWECRHGLRACVQYSCFSRVRGQWERQTIWCDPHELRDLAGALDDVSL